MQRKRSGAKEENHERTLTIEETRKHRVAVGHGAHRERGPRAPRARGPAKPQWRPRYSGWFGTATAHPRKPVHWSNHCGRWGAKFRVFLAFPFVAPRSFVP